MNMQDQLAAFEQVEFRRKLQDNHQRVSAGGQKAQHDSAEDDWDMFDEPFEVEAHSTSDTPNKKVRFEPPPPTFSEQALRRKMEKYEACRDELERLKRLKMQKRDKPAEKEAAKPDVTSTQILADLSKTISDTVRRFNNSHVQLMRNIRDNEQEIERLKIFEPKVGSITGSQGKEEVTSALITAIESLNKKNDELTQQVRRMEDELKDMQEENTLLRGLVSKTSCPTCKKNPISHKVLVRVVEELNIKPDNEFISLDDHRSLPDSWDSGFIPHGPPSANLAESNLKPTKPADLDMAPEPIVITDDRMTVNRLKMPFKQEDVHVKGRPLTRTMTQPPRIISRKPMPMIGNQNFASPQSAQPNFTIKLLTPEESKSVMKTYTRPGGVSSSSSTMFMNIQPTNTTARMMNISHHRSMSPETILPDEAIEMPSNTSDHTYTTSSATTSSTSDIQVLPHDLNSDVHIISEIEPGDLAPGVSAAEAIWGTKRTAVLPTKRPKDYENVPYSPHKNPAAEYLLYDLYYKRWYRMEDISLLFQRTRLVVKVPRDDPRFKTVKETQKAAKNKKLHPTEDDPDEEADLVIVDQLFESSQQTDDSPASSQTPLPQEAGKSSGPAAKVKRVSHRYKCASEFCRNYPNCARVYDRWQAVFAHILFYQHYYRAGCVDTKCKVLSRSPYNMDCSHERPPGGLKKFF